MSTRAVSVVAAVIVFAHPLRAQGTDTTHAKFSAFVDSYYAFDFNRPASFDRAYTTQPARHNEFNVNLAYVDATVTRGRAHGRLALQGGTSVQANYAGEPTTGAVSGPDLTRHLQEAWGGYQVTSTLSIDGGIFFSNAGMESFISRDNPTYTRSLVADYSPYYSSGVRAIWQASPSLAVRVDVVNGWQNISETNQDKAAGVRLDYTPSSSTTFSYYNYAGNEAGGRLRLFNGIGLKFAATSRTNVLAELDAGDQARSTRGHANWYGATLIGRHDCTATTAIVARIERYSDPHQVLIATGTNNGFRANGASLGIDVTPQSGVMWRTEVRGFQADRRVFPARDSVTASPSRQDAFVVSSLALTF